MFSLIPRFQRPLCFREGMPAFCIHISFSYYYDATFKTYGILNHCSGIVRITENANSNLKLFIAEMYGDLKASALCGLPPLNAMKLFWHSKWCRVWISVAFVGSVCVLFCFFFGEICSVMDSIVFHFSHECSNSWMYSAPLAFMSGAVVSCATNNATNTANIPTSTQHWNLSCGCVLLFLFLYNVE